jgi:hypothetical protein
VVNRELAPRPCPANCQGQRLGFIVEIQIAEFLGSEWQLTPSLPAPEIATVAG